MSGAIQRDLSGDGPAVVTHALSKRYRDAVALDRVDLLVPEGAVYVLVGLNGAGKSTLIKILMNLERASTGSAAVFGLDSVTRGPEVRAQIGYVPERHDAGGRAMRCGRLLQYLAAYYPSWDHAYAEHLVRVLEIQPNRWVGGLSKGEARRLQLVMALAHRPPLLLLDEPTDGLDPIVRRRVLTLLAEHLADAPTTVLISTHQVYEVESLADHVGVLRAGRLVAQMPRTELHRMVRRYRVDVPEDWTLPAELHVATARRSRAGREAECTIVGQEHDIVERLTATGAQVREASALPLEDAALAFLEEAS